MLRTLLTLSFFGFYATHGMSSAPDAEETPYFSAGLAEALAKAGYIVNGTRRTESYYKYPPIIKTKYNDQASNGDGYNFHKAQWTARALGSFSGTLDSSLVSQKTTYLKKIVTSASDYADSMRATASVNVRYETVSASVDASFERNVAYSSKDALFLIHGEKLFGFYGWKSTETPPISDWALDILCPPGSGGELQKQKFEQIFGTHYVVGQTKGTTLDITVHTSTTTSSSENKVSASVSVAFEEFVVDGDASASFSNELKQSSSITSITVTSDSTGVDKDFLGNPDIDHLEDTVNKYNEQSTDGTGLSTVLRSYEQHPHYIQATLRCQDNGKALQPVNRDYLRKLVNVAVEAKLMADDILDRVGDERADACTEDLAHQAFVLYNELRVYTDENVSLDSVVSAQEKMRALTDKWDDDSNRCRDGPPPDLSCVEFGWDYYGNDLDQVTASSNQECQARCAELKGCRYWTFQPSHDLCWLKSSNKGRFQQDDENSGARNCKNYGCYHLHVDFNGNDVHVIEEVDSAYDCQVLCATYNTGECKYFTWLTDNGECWLKTSDAGNRESLRAVSGSASCNSDCPLGFDKYGSSKPCTKPGFCCTMDADANDLEEEGIAKNLCRVAGGEWMKLDYRVDPYTCWLPERSVEVAVGSSDSCAANSACRPSVNGGSLQVTVSVQYDDLVCPGIVNNSNWIGVYDWTDSYKVTVQGRSITVVRTDAPGVGWGLDLRFLCYRPTFRRL